MFISSKQGHTEITCDSLMHQRLYISIDMKSLKEAKGSPSFVVIVVLQMHQIFSWSLIKLLFDLCFCAGVNLRSIWFMAVFCQLMSSTSNKIIFPSHSHGCTSIPLYSFLDWYCFEFFCPNWNKSPAPWTVPWKAIVAAKKSMIPHDTWSDLFIHFHYVEMQAGFVWIKYDYKSILLIP